MPVRASYSAAQSDPRLALAAARTLHAGMPQCSDAGRPGVKDPIHALRISTPPRHRKSCPAGQVIGDQKNKVHAFSWRRRGSNAAHMRTHGCACGWESPRFAVWLLHFLRAAHPLCAADMTGRRHCTTALDARWSTRASMMRARRPRMSGLFRRCRSAGSALGAGRLLRRR